MLRVLLITILLTGAAHGQTSAPLPYLSLPRLDRDGDQRISVDEFLAAAAPTVTARFTGIDTNRDRVLSRSELDTARAASETRFQALALDDPARAEYAAMPTFEELDTDRDGRVDRAEFATAQEQSLRRRFQVLDRDGDGSLTGPEFEPARRRFLEHLGRPRETAPAPEP